jgi:PiT family inorganic phosphate transporter
MFGLETQMFLLMVLCLVAAAAFEFINGFHDTANAVATVIYTHSLKPGVAVVLSGILNFVGVMVGGVAVAMGIINLLPTAMLVDSDVMHSVSMILALLLSAIIWNLGTWYFGIPCSSSHTLIGSILGVGLAYSLLPDAAAGTQVNWKKAEEIGISLLVSPLFGFGAAMLLMWLARTFIKVPKLFSEPDSDMPPPWPIRALLIFTCSSVSFFHGSNDGQKGVGLVMLILIGFAPVYFGLNHTIQPGAVTAPLAAFEQATLSAASRPENAAFKKDLEALKTEAAFIGAELGTVAKFSDLSKEQVLKIRENMIFVYKGAGKLEEKGVVFTADEKAQITSGVNSVKSYIEYAPRWVILMISISLGLGTMIGWKRIVVTIGEKIGKQHLTYAQGASAELIAASTIGLSTSLGLPVSTTHVLSSGIAGAMVANKGLGNLQTGTIANIAIAWLLTLPVTIVLAGGLFLLFRLIF